ncbi:MAG TPA: hypothetical protein VK528_12695 [Flavobacterium sp.]|nr:hypothetical protein [Flavobacterium sp.]
MKTKTFLSLALCAVLFLSCKDDKKTEAEGAAPAQTEENNEHFAVDVDVVTDKDDDIPLYYTEDNTIKFEGDDHVAWHNIKAQAGPQHVTLSLPDEAIPTHIRIDFGIKLGEAQGDVTLNKFKMSYFGKSFEFKGSDFLKYFIKNDSVNTEIDEAKGTITFKKNPKSKLNRFYYPQQSIVDEVSKITK